MDITSQMIKDLLREADIEGYIEFGAPADEYNSEAHAITLALAELDEISVEIIAAIVSAVWRESFNLDDADLRARQENINNFSRLILQNKKNHQQ